MRAVCKVFLRRIGVAGSEFDSQLVIPDPAVGRLVTHNTEESGRCLKKGCCNKDTKLVSDW